ncbi:hypothetical protein ACES2L_06040 [Bdellovibrio bacteriovorus]
MPTAPSWSSSNLSAGDYAQAGAKGVAAMMKGDLILGQGRYQEKQARLNAAEAERAAADAIVRGEKQADQINRKTKQLVGEQRAALAAQGIDVNTDSAAELQEDSHYWGAMDELTTRNNAFLESYGYKMQAVQLREQAEIQRATTDFQYRMTMVEGGMEMAQKIAAGGAG